jgi:hypothetical protein
MKSIAAFIVIILALVVFGIVMAARRSYKEKQEYTSHLGQKVVVDKDTLTVVDYSTWFETYTLSNGQKISIDYFKKK